MNSNPSVNTQTQSPGTQIRIEGMTCDHCVRAVTRALAGVPGLQVRSVVVGKAVVDGGDAGVLERAVEAIRAAGYEAVREQPVPAATPGPGAAASKGCGCCGSKGRIAG